MKILRYSKDGGYESTVEGLYFIEVKSLFTVVLLHFYYPGSRDAYHSHAFNAVSWALSGKLTEYVFKGNTNEYTASFKPVSTQRTMFHKVVSEGHTYVLSFRGPWSSTWQEFIPDTQQFVTLTHGRKVVSD